MFYRVLIGFYSSWRGSQVIGANYSPNSQALSIDHAIHAPVNGTLIRRKPATELIDGDAWCGVGFGEEWMGFWEVLEDFKWVEGGFGEVILEVLKGF